MSSLTITTIQSELHWENKQANLEMFQRKIETINKTEVIILPEMFSTGFTMDAARLAEPMDGQSVKWMRDIATRKRIILTGSLIISEKDEISGEMRFYNRMLWMLPNGKCGYYDKRHLFAYAGEDRDYTPGNKRLIASVKGWRVNLIVCYDLRFPVWIRQAGYGETPEYDLVICVANWPNRRANAWKTLLQARAIENQCFVAGVNRVGVDGKGHKYDGDSMVVDPLGEALYQNTGEEDIHTITLEKSRLESVREALPFWKDADRFKIGD